VAGRRFVIAGPASAPDPEVIDGVWETVTSDGAVGLPDAEQPDKIADSPSKTDSGTAQPRCDLD
jgi:hypothetical protein